MEPESEELFQWVGITVVEKTSQLWAHSAGRQHLEPGTESRYRLQAVGFLGQRLIMLWAEDNLPSLLQGCDWLWSGMEGRWVFQGGDCSTTMDCGWEQRAGGSPEKRNAERYWTVSKVNTIWLWVSVCETSTVYTEIISGGEQARAF